jgi:hypothetical protein
MKIKYVHKRCWHKTSLLVIDQANTIIEEYMAQGYLLTLRQLYYQFVSRDLLPNTVKDYNRLGSIINDARLGGLVDWDAIEDRTRNLHVLPTWSSPKHILSSVAEQYKTDLWENQDHHVEVWIEKEALSGVFQRVCDEKRIGFFACRGYVSQSEMWSASQRFLHLNRRGKENIHILHFGDHDPSGLDMTRDIRDRLNIFLGEDMQCNFTVDRLALNMDQVDQYEPPPNPAKETDSRFWNYRQEFGDESWELDALPPDVLANLVSTEVDKYIYQMAWNSDLRAERAEKSTLEKIADKYNTIAKRYGGKQ